MSELGESGHLRTENIEHAVALLVRARVPGYVFPARNGWVSFVYPPGDESRFDISQANDGLLVLYEYAADHGCWVTVHQAKKPITRLRAAFDRPNASFDRRAFEALALLTPAAAAAVAAWVERAHLLHERVRAPHLVAERLHLPRHAWFSFLAEQTNASPDPQRVEVLASGSVKRPPPPSAPHVAVTTPAAKRSRSQSKTAKGAKPGGARKARTSASKAASKKVTPKTAAPNGAARKEAAPKKAASKTAASKTAASKTAASKTASRRR